MPFEQLCRGILDLPPDITFACIADLEGKIAAIEFRHDLESNPSREESELSIMQALIRMNTRKTMEHVTGRPIFSVTEYENVIRSTILIQDPENNCGLGSELVVIVSIEKTADPFKIVKDRIIPFFKELNVRAI